MTTTTTYIARKNGKRCKIRVKRVGVNFGWIAQLVALNGRVIDDTEETYPFASAAEQAAIGLTR
jgi:hypothetical protein